MKLINREMMTIEEQLDTLLDLLDAELLEYETNFAVYYLIKREKKIICGVRYSIVHKVCSLEKVNSDLNYQEVIYIAQLMEVLQDAKFRRDIK